MDLNHEELNLTELLQSVVDMFRIQAWQKGLCLCWEMDPQVPLSLVGDPVRLRQILVNLLGNALKFTQQGEVKVNIGKAEEDATDEVVTLLCSVTDTGIGIPEDKKGLLFESFSQADSSTSKRYAGTGLGLAICKRLTGMMGGQIWFESTEGKGTSFHFTVRFPKSSMEKTKKSSETGASRPQDLRGLKILLAEDNKIIQMALRQVVEQLGASCVTVSNGKEVMSSLEAGGFDVVLMDVQMPEMDGVEATRAIRKSESGRIDPSIPIIGLTAYAMEGDRERFLRAGMNDCVFKPMEDEELHDAIKRLVTARLNSNPIYREPHPAPPRKPRP
jgi:CheY-like chemotaxis protein